MFESLPSACLLPPGTSSGKTLARVGRRQRVNLLARLAEGRAPPDLGEHLRPDARTARDGTLAESAGAPDGSIALQIHRRRSRVPPECHVFRQPIVLIGRSPDADLVLPDARLEAMHIYLQAIEGRWAAVDLPLIAGQPVDPGRQVGQWLDPGEQLPIGPYVMTRLGTSSTALNQASLTPPAAGLATVVVEYLNGRGPADRQQSHTLNGPITLLGSSRRCDLCLRDESIADVHASLVRTRCGVWVADLCRTGSVIADGVPVFWSQLEDGAVLQVGKFLFRVQFGGSRGRHAGWFESAGGRSPACSAQPASGLSERGLLAIVEQFREMQDRFTDHTSRQMDLMTDLFRALTAGDSSRGLNLDEGGQPHAARPSRPLANEDGGEDAGRSRKQKRRRKRKVRSVGQGAPRPLTPRSGLSAGRMAVASVTTDDQDRATLSSPGFPSRKDTSGTQTEPADKPPWLAPADTTHAHDRLTERMARAASNDAKLWNRLRRIFGK